MNGFRLFVVIIVVFLSIFDGGDYMNIEPTGYYQLNGVATLDYYHEAIDYIRQYVDTPHFYVFSNDLIVQGAIRSREFFLY